MIRQVLFGLILCLASTLVDAKDRHGGPPPVDRLVEQLALTEQQEVAVREIMREHHAEMRSLDEASATREARVGIREATSAQMQNVLSQEQFEQFQALRPPQRGQGNGHRRPEASQ